MGGLALLHLGVCHSGLLVQSVQPQPLLRVTLQGLSHILQFSFKVRFTPHCSLLPVLLQCNSIPINLVGICKLLFPNQFVCVCVCVCTCVLNPYNDFRSLVGLDCIPAIVLVSVGHKIRTPLGVWWSATKVIKEKCLPGVLYLSASGKYNSKNVLFLDPSAFDYRKQQLNCSRNEVRLI